MNVPRVTYKRSYLSKMIQSESTVQNYYSAIKNKLLSYKGVKSRISFNYESFNKGRVPCAKVNIKGKTLVMYLALKPSDYVGTKYFFTDVSSIAKYETVPMLIKVKSDRGLKYAFQLIEDMMGKHLGIAALVQNNIDYTMPYETDEQLIARGLIKLGGSKTAVAAATAVIEEKYGAINETPVYDDLVPQASEGSVGADEPEVKVKKVASKKTAKKGEKTEPVECASAETVIEAEPVAVKEESSSEPEINEEVIVPQNNGISTVKLEEPADEDVLVILAPLVESKNGKAIVNIDLISENFAAGETVSLDTLKEKNIIGFNVTYVKILARGNISKPVKVVANKYSLNAFKAIVNAGGEAK